MPKPVMLAIMSNREANYLLQTLLFRWVQDGNEGSEFSVGLNHIFQHISSLKHGVETGVFSRWMYVRCG